MSFNPPDIKGPVKVNYDVESSQIRTSKVTENLIKVSEKLNDLFLSDLKDDDTKRETNDTNSETNDNSGEKSGVEKQVQKSIDTIKAMFENLFSDDVKTNDSSYSQESNTNEEENTKSNELFNEIKNEDTSENDSKDETGESGIEKDSVMEQIEKSIGTVEGIKELMARHPEKLELWKSQLEALETLNDSEATPAEIRSAQAKLSILKGQILETAVKDALSDAGLDVESQQRVVEGENGRTRPDVIAKNNSDYPIVVLGETIQPGETICIECKCGLTAYMTNQLMNHIPNQLSGQPGTKILLTTSDINNVTPGLAESVCSTYGAKLKVPNVSVVDVEAAIKEVSKV